jgi:hypothetical protein
MNCLTPLLRARGHVAAEGAWQEGRGHAVFHLPTMRVCDTQITMKCPRSSFTVIMLAPRSSGRDAKLIALLPTRFNVLARYFGRRLLANAHHTDSLSDCGSKALCNTKARRFPGNVRRGGR